jgi:hypothetical protein
MKQREALEKSIRKWIKIAQGTGVDEGTDNCALCTLYYSDSGCSPKCPVVKATKANYCCATPYAEWSNCFTQGACKADRKIANATEKLRAKNAAYAMAGFLVSLKK